MNPPNRSSYSVWNWPRWVWGVMALLLVAFYFLSAAPALYLAETAIGDGDYDKSAGNQVLGCLVMAYLPAMLCAQNVQFYGAIFEWEIACMEWIEMMVSSTSVTIH